MFFIFLMITAPPCARFAREKDILLLTLYLYPTGKNPVNILQRIGSLITLDFSDSQEFSFFFDGLYNSKILFFYYFSLGNAY